jgi:hypothetical protein
VWAPGISHIHDKLSLIDVAGSETAAEAFSAKSRTRMVAAEISESLLGVYQSVRQESFLSPISSQQAHPCAPRLIRLAEIQDTYDSDD